MKRLAAPLFVMLAASWDAHAHDMNGALTWNREVSRVFYTRCGSCHHEGGAAFSLMTFRDVQPRADAIKEAVLSRRMPPWGAVKGFRDFRDDKSLTQEEIEVIIDWIDGGMSRGNNPNLLPEEPRYSGASSYKPPRTAIPVAPDSAISTAVVVDGLWPERFPAGTSAQIVAELPDGSVEPLVWFYQYDERYRHPFLFKSPVMLPAGSIIRGIPASAAISLLPGKPRPPSAPADRPGFEAAGSRSSGRTSKTVSVNELKAPGKARDFYRDALGALNKHDYPKAQELLDEALEIYPLYAKALNARGIVLSMTGSPQDGERDFRAALVLDSELVEAHFNLGKLLLDSARPVDAQAELRRAMDLDHTHKEAMHLLLHCMLANHEEDSAVSLLEHLHSRRFDHQAGMHLELAAALEDDGRRDLAGVHYGLVLKEKPSAQEKREAAAGLARVGTRRE